MSGFYVELGAAGARFPLPLAQVIDFGGCELTGSFNAPGARAAWAHIEGTRQWSILRHRHRLILIEGNPDRLPAESDLIHDWLAGRKGSFRGFELVTQRQHGAPPRLTAFVDPWASRPLFYLARNGTVAVADKLATLVVNAGVRCEVDWAAVLEACGLGSVRSHGTTLEGAIGLSPGEALRFERGCITMRWHFPVPPDDDITEEAMARDPGRALWRAVEKAVQETWINRDGALLLSGGLDSRAILAAAGPGRKAVTMELRKGESPIAASIAKACSAEYDILELPPNQWPHIAEHGYLMTAAMYDARFLVYLGIGQRFRRLGVRSVTHGYLFDTYLKGWCIYPRQRFPTENTILLRTMGIKGVAIHNRKFRTYRLTPDALGTFMTSDGLARFEGLLARCAAGMPYVCQDGFDLTQESNIIESISRQPHFPFQLAWCEDVDVEMPIFHPALWHWHMLSRVRERFGGRLFRQTLAHHRHPAFRIADANTGKPIAQFPDSSFWKLRVKDNPIAAAAIRFLNKLNPSTSEFDPPRRVWFAQPFRSRKAFSIIQEGVAQLPADLFYMPAIDKGIQRFAAGDDRLLEPLLVVAGVGQWARFVKEGLAPGQKVIRSISYQSESHAACA